MAEQWTNATGTALRVAHEVLLRGPTSRAELAREFDVNPATLTRITKDFVDTGLMVEVAPEVAETRVGRPSQPIDVVVGDREFVGVKIAGDALFGVRTTLRAQTLAQATEPLATTDPEAIADAVAAMIGRLSPRPATAIGVSVGGFVRDGVVQRAPFLGDQKIDLATLLHRRLGRAVTVANDLVAVAEFTHWFGQGRDLDRFALVTLGAGLGSALVVHGKLVEHDETMHAQASHLPVVPWGPRCQDGHHGCAETVLTNRAIEAAATLAGGHAVDHPTVLAQAAAGLEPARSVIDDAGYALGRMIGMISTVAIPELVVVGGEGATLAQVAHAAVADGVASVRGAGMPAVPIEVQPGGLMTWAVGAAVVAIQAYVGA